MVKTKKIVYIGTDKWYKCLKNIYHNDSIEISKCYVPNIGGELHELCKNLDIPFTITKNINKMSLMNIINGFNRRTRFNVPLSEL